MEQKLNLLTATRKAKEMELYQRVKAIRKALKESEETFAARCLIGLSTLKHLESGKKAQMSTIERIAVGLCIHPKTLLSRSYEDEADGGMPIHVWLGHNYALFDRTKKRICSICTEERDLNKYNFYSNNDFLHYRCALCYNEKMRNYYHETKAKRFAQQISQSQDRDNGTELR